MSRIAKPYLLFAVLSITCWAQSAQIVSVKPVHGIPTRQKAAQSTTTNNGIVYHGGPVLNLPSGTNVYFIWYGNWSGDSSKQILIDMVQRLRRIALLQYQHHLLRHRQDGPAGPGVQQSELRDQR